MVATCGYDTRGTARLAAPDFNCRVDTEKGIWGFCPSSVNYARDCGLAGYCIDDFECASGCGPHPDNTDVTTFTCEKKSHCSTVISDNIDFGHSYYYIACGAKADVETIFARPPRVSATTTSSTSSSTVSSTASSTSSISSTTTSSTLDSSSIASSNTFGSASMSTPTTSTVSGTTSPLPLSSATNEPVAAAERGNSTPFGPIIGGVVGGLAMVCLTVLAIFYIRHRRASSTPSNTPLRRTSSCTKHAEQEEQFEIHELGDPRRRLFEASEANNDPAELPAYDSSQHRSAV